MSNTVRCSILVVAACSVLGMMLQELCSGQELGRGTRTISGLVVLRGSVVGAVRVTIASASRTFQRTVFTDGSGSFGISGVPAGQYTFELEAEGYLTLRESVEVPPGSGVIAAQFVMRPVPPARVPSTEELVVSAASLQVPRAAADEFAAGQRESERQRWKEAKHHFEKALQKHSDFPQALRGLALLDLLAQRPEQALEHLRHAVEIDCATRSV